MGDATIGDQTMLVVGATGILAPLVATVAGRGEAVTAVARHAGADGTPGAVGRHAGADGTPGAGSPGPSAGSPARGRVTPLAADATTTDGVARVVAAGPFAAAVLYGPAVIAPGGDSPAPELLAAVTGRAVLVLTSSAADPAGGGEPSAVATRRRPRVGDVVLLLGWTGPADRPRWHTPEQVSAAALTALEDGRDGILGHVRPWDGRPRDNA